MNNTVIDQFPILKKQVYDKRLVYLDNAATTQKPERVIKALNKYYRDLNSNIHRGVHYLSQEATLKYENSRNRVKEFINAASSDEIVFTRGTTESINLVASSFARAFCKPGSEILISAMEHHSNIVPWQLACEQFGLKLKVIPINDDGELLLDTLDKLITRETAIIAVTHISNTLGTINPVKEIINRARKNGVYVLIDGAQSVPHIKVDVQDLDADFYCFSGHKMYAPMGIGVLYGKEELLKKMPPYQGGGEMIDNVTFDGSTYNDLPFKFEAGTPNVGAAIALSEAIDFITEIGYDEIGCLEDELMKYATLKLESINGMRIIGKAKNKAGVISFLIDEMHPYDIGMIMDKFGVAVRTGNHCTQPLMDHFRISGTVRVSFGIYNTIDDIDRMIDALNKAVEMLK